MRAVIIENPGDLGVLQLGSRDVRAAGPDEVRIAVKAAAVNPTDLLMRENGAGPNVPKPWTPGMDAAGTIESVGAGVTRLKAGDAVMAVTTPPRPEGGAQAELILRPPPSVRAVPPGGPLS